VVGARLNHFVLLKLQNQHWLQARYVSLDTQACLCKPQLEAKDCCSDAALHYAHVVLPWCSLRLCRAREGVGYHKCDALRQGNILCVKVLQGEEHMLSESMQGGLCSAAQTIWHS